MENSISSHKDLDIWKRSIDLVVETYKITATFPDSEKFGLTNQMRRASVSVPSNIAEGSARKSSKEYLQFLYISQGSLSELDTQYIIAERLKYCNTIDHVFQEIKSLKLMIGAVIKKIQSKM